MSQASLLFRSDEENYAHPTLPANQYAARIQSLKAKHLRLVKGLRDNLKIEVPPNLLAVLESRPNAGQPPVMVAELVQSPLHSRMLRNRAGLNPRGPSPPSSRAASPAQAARQRMQDLRNRARGRRPGIGR
jgi:hypothetical protein